MDHGAGDVEEEEDVSLRRAERRRKRQQFLEQIKNSNPDEDDVEQVMSQNSFQADGAFCTILFAVCVVVFYLLEFGNGFTGSHYSMQSSLSEYFEDRIINLGLYAESVKVEDKESYINDLMTIHDIRSADHLPIFARFVVDLLYSDANLRLDISEIDEEQEEDEKKKELAAEAANQKSENLTLSEVMVATPEEQSS